ncbi:MAG: right-handed parallel beta-helix repeat-containing protein [Cyclobacteriaceae bacterium]|nr:right-handed parallel beta-helix repeat-containing protein [Cyclobacteriaceae bacterium]
MKPQSTLRVVQRSHCQLWYAFLNVFFVFFLIKSLNAQDSRPTKLTVAQDGSGDYTTIQEAINACRDLGYARVTIHIKKGIYKEKLIIPSWKTNITLLGEDREHTIISYDDYSGKENPKAGAEGEKPKLSTFTSYTMLVQGNDITIENLTIQNTAGRVGQAVALHIEGDRVVVKNCNITGNQDTLLVTRDGSRQYFKDCYIEGTTDFIFGEATALFVNCTIKSLSNSFITAASTREHTAFGLVFQHCKLLAGGEATNVYLGRPWRPFARTVFMQCELGSHIRVEGWDPWKGDAMFPDKDKTAFYAEYKNYGSGADTSKRVGWSKQLTKKEAKQYTVKNIFQDWNPDIFLNR